VYTLFGHGVVTATSITPGVAGGRMLMFNVLAELVPQPLVDVTLTVPEVKPAG
jgi:hypothetical protein